METTMVEIPLYAKSKTVEAIEAARVGNAAPRHSRRLGGSIVGDECGRKIWYGFRWAYAPEQFDGRMLRLFETGEVEEHRLLNDLRRAGIVVFNEQAEMSVIGGHGVAKIDAMASGVPEAPKAWHVVECKTHNHKSFTALKKDGVRKAKPMHFAQMQFYMHAMDAGRALYLAKNKNDDELYAERVELEYDYAVGLFLKAEAIIKAQHPPAKLHEDPNTKAAWACNYCVAKPICHDGVFAQRNCRTCLHATPEMQGDGRWSCAHHGRDLTHDEMPAGCGHHRYLPALVPGDVLDADEDANLVFYQLRDGHGWTDDGRAAA
jgi:hypothetical protein